LETSYRPNLHLALVHYPVINKNGDIIPSAITGLDLHDMARAGKTYGVRSFYVLTPLKDQQILAERLTAHWKAGAGAAYNPVRREALELIHIRNSISEAVAHIRSMGEGDPKTLVTCARDHQGSLSHARFRDMLKNGLPYLLMFGTAWGLSPEVIAGADYILEPIKGNTEYNHLSVRSAASIILDRLLRPEMV